MAHTHTRAAAALAAAALALALCCGAAPARASGEHLASGGDEFEWAGLFALPEDVYTWIAQKTGSGEDIGYVDPAMKMAVLPAANGTEAALHALESEANHSLEENCTDVPPNGVISVRADACVRIVFDAQMYQTTFKLSAPAHEYVAVFAQHSPLEFEADRHYLVDDHGHNVEPVHTLAGDAHGHGHGAVPPLWPLPLKESEDGNAWRPAILASFIVLVVTCIGVGISLGFINFLSKAAVELTEVCAMGMAAGALLGCAFYLILVEASHYIASDYNKEEVDATWRWGTMTLAGVLLPYVFHVFCHSHDDGGGAGTAGAEKAGAEKGDAEKGDVVCAIAGGDEAGAMSLAKKARICVGVLVGDFMHNVVDGVIIGTGFQLCDRRAGWTIAAATIGHELVQEVADGLILLRRANLTLGQALLANFISGTSIMVGTVIVLCSDVSSSAQGLLLAFGGGAYISMAAIECMPAMVANSRTLEMKVAALVSFAIGTIVRPARARARALSDEHTGTMALGD